MRSASKSNTLCYIKDLLESATKEDLNNPLVIKIQAEIDAVFAGCQELKQRHNGANVLSCSIEHAPF